MLLFRDLRIAVRGLARSPGFTAVAVLTLMLGIGANTAVFSFLFGAFLKPLVYPHPEEVVRVLERPPGGGIAGVSVPAFLDWQKQSSVFQFIAAQSIFSASLTGVAEPVVLRGTKVSATYFDIARTKPTLGRTFLPEEEEPGKNRVVILSHRIWVSSLGADPGIINKTILLDNQPYTVVGVMAADSVFDRGAATAVWEPFSLDAGKMDRSLRWFGVFGRLKPGITLERARSEMDTIAGRIAQEHPDTNRGFGVALDRYSDILVGPQLRRSVYTLMIAAGLVLLSACFNLANLSLARGVARQREVAVRASLGAGRATLVRQFLTESLVLALAGGAGGVGLGYGMMKWLNSQIAPGTLPAEISINLDGQVLVFALILSCVTGLLFGLGPAWQAARMNLASSLKDGGRGSSSGAGRRLRDALVIAEVSLAFILLVGAGLLIRSFFQLITVDVGFDSRNALALRLATSREQYPDVERLNTYLRSVRSAVSAIPGVTGSAFTSAVPLRGQGYLTPFSRAGDNVKDPSQRFTCFIKMVSPSYFRTLGIKLRRGRELQETDVKGAPLVAVLNESLAKRYFGERNPVGEHLTMPEIKAGLNEFGENQSWEVVGIIADERIDDINGDNRRGLYVSNQQVGYYNPNLVVRTSMNPRLMERSIRQAIAALNSSQAYTEVATLDEIKAETLAESRLQAILLGAFSITALLLAALGIYGVLSYAVTQRAAELGIRSALGATAANLQGLILGDGLTLIVIGLVLGVIGAFILTKEMASLLFGVGPWDPATMTSVAALLAVVALVACYLPARRATRTDPMLALRRE